MTPPLPPSPSELAVDARRRLNARIEAIIKQLNDNLIANYHLSVQAIVEGNKQGAQVEHPLPIPDPPKGWKVGTYAELPEDQRYDAQFGLPPVETMVPGDEPVCPKYVDQTGPGPVPAGTVLRIGPALPDGRYACMPDDNMPDNYLAPGPGGVMLRKVSRATPWGVAKWYEVVPA